MKPIAAQIAKKKASRATTGMSSRIEKEQLVGDAILPFYQQRLKQIEGIIEQRRLVTLPDRPARIRIASAAESAQQPAPHMISAAIAPQHRPDRANLFCR